MSVWGGISEDRGEGRLRAPFCDCEAWLSSKAMWAIERRLLRLELVSRPDARRIFDFSASSSWGLGEALGGGGRCVVDGLVEEVIFIDDNEDIRVR